MGQIKEMPEAVIRVHIYAPLILTVEQFEQLSKEVVAAYMADPETVSFRVLTRLLMDNRSRYYEAKAQNEGRNNGTT